MILKWIHLFYTKKNDIYDLIQADNDNDNNLSILIDKNECSFKNLIEQLVHYKTGMPIIIHDNFELQTEYENKYSTYEYILNKLRYRNHIDNRVQFACVSHSITKNNIYFILLNLNLTYFIKPVINTTVAYFKQTDLQNKCKLQSTEFNNDTDIFFNIDNKEISYDYIYFLLFII